MNYLLDTNVLIELNGNNEKVIAQVNELLGSATGEPCITLFNFAEFYAGAIRKKQEAEAMAFLNSFNQLTLSQASAQIYAELWNKYARKGSPLAVFDLLIASVAIASNATLLTLDKDFEKIDELKKIMLAI
jgi:tRNA(fMet)-specific endonuclease VapC